MLCQASMDDVVLLALTIQMNTFYFFIFMASIMLKSLSFIWTYIAAPEKQFFSVNDIRLPILP